MSYLRSLAVLSAWEDDLEQAVNHLRKAEAIAEDIAPPGELWQIQSRIGELYERRGEAGEARKAFSRAAQTVRDLAERIKTKQLRENFLSAPRVRRVLARL
jgi:tetratricopeptide (TPR) repeat protein